MKQLTLMGAAGRMGVAILKLVSQHQDLSLSEAIVSPSSPLLGQDCGEYALQKQNSIKFSSTLSLKTDVLIDVATIENHDKAIDWAVQNRIAYVMGTTDLNEKTLKALEDAARFIPVLVASNFSKGVTLLDFLCEQMAASNQDREFEVEMIEKHHHHKKDAPSGTALSLAKTISQASLTPYKLQLGNPKKNTARLCDQLPIHSIRAGNIFGQHELMWVSESESISLSHQALSRDCFAKGALKAASFVTKQAPGLYSMRDCYELPQLAKALSGIP